MAGKIVGSGTWMCSGFKGAAQDGVVVRVVGWLSGTGGATIKGLVAWGGSELDSGWALVLSLMIAGFDIRVTIMISNQPISHGVKLLYLCLQVIKFC